MKKSVLSVVLLITMLVSVIAPMGVFATTADLGAFLNDHDLSDIIDGSDDVYTTYDPAIPATFDTNDLDKIRVPANIQLRQSGGVYGDGPNLHISASSTDPSPYTFDFQATLDMSPVRQAFTDYINGARAIINSHGGPQKDALLADLAAVPITGSFTIVIEYTDGLDVDVTGVKSKTAMNDFIIDSNSNGTFEETESYNVRENIYKESSRTNDDPPNPDTNGSNWDMITITVDVKKPNTDTGVLTAGDFLNPDGTVNETNVKGYFADLALECTGVKLGEVNKTYLVKGSVTGNTKIGGGTDTIANIIYKADQKGETNNPPSIDLREVRLIYMPGSPSSSGGGARYVVVKFDVDGDTTEIDSMKLKSGTTVDFDTIERPTKEGYIFDGFYYDEECTEKVSGEVKITKNTTIYARWIEQGDVSVVVDVNGKTDVAGPFIVKRGETINFDELPYPTKEGYAFDGYYSDKDFTTKLSGAMVINEDMLVYGRWLKTEAPDVLNSEEHLAYIAGYPNGEIRPFNNISREEVATIFYRILKKEKQQEFYAATNSFTDVEDDRWSNEAISTIANGGYVIGYEDGTFRPEDYITRAEFVTIVARFHDVLSTRGTPYHDIAGHWAENYIITAAEQGWIDGYEDGSFRPDEYITRADVIRIINRLLVRWVNEEGLHADARQWIDNFEDSEYYYDILEATNSHDYERQSDNYHETWSAILSESLIIDELFYEN